MSDKSTNENLRFRDGILAGLPIVIGYLPIAVAYGILAKSTGVTLFHSFAFSAFVYAGASQFMALNMIAIGAGVGEIVVTTLLVNLRHFIMSASLASGLKRELSKYFPIIAFGVTDEVFSVLSIKEGEKSKEFIFGLQAAAYTAWVGGTMIGYIAGGLLPAMLAGSMVIALYGMFAALLVSAIKKSHKLAVYAAASGTINALLSYIGIMSKGWNMVAAIIIVAAVGAFIPEGKEVTADE